MIISFPSILTNQELKLLSEYLEAQELGYKTAVHQGKSILILRHNLDMFQKESVKSIIPGMSFTQISTPYQLSSSEWKKERTVIDVKGARIGGEEICMIAGPCAVESEEQMYTTAEYMRSRGIKFLRGGAYKPRTSPYAFQGMRTEGLKLLKKVANDFEMRIVTELMDLTFLEEVYDYADVIQIGTRNMFNYQLLKELGKIDKPIMLKRGFSAKVEEWLLAAEYILLGGNEKVILCERGIRTFETETRNTMDLASLSLAKELSHLPVIADPSQGTGIRSLVTPMSYASVAAGADGLMIEVHHMPEEALSDGQQSLNFKQFDDLLKGLKGLFNDNARSFDFEQNSFNFTPVK